MLTQAAAVLIVTRSEGGKGEDVRHTDAPLLSLVNA